MKKIIPVIFVILLMFSNIAFASDDLWDNYGDPNAYGRKAVTDDEFDKALKEKTGKKRNRNIPRGKEMYQSNESTTMKETEEELPVLCVPVDLWIAKDKVLPVGHYQVEGYVKDGKYFLKFYQAHFKIAEIPVFETKNDFSQESVHFIKLLEHGNGQVKIIFGSLDFNAYVVLRVVE